ncbi:hypothetical protein PPERSA_03240 [Pseudocohnilembus persalinus]|uniref:Uncharacterized protein n=1 Tax=Pseudocohnilembus persalinus TaxID=266149 RepID=A0A0V0QYM9_PSEPJ|nr:hypothetical protein PPERSA_03240 [Pseudocohnilembus persalinus]|eukprot:KRX07407.1 hypothetical protein PPERSA_03240 [Pseudocohnilembus persalinus]
MYFFFRDDLKVQISAQEKNKDKVKEPIIYLTRSRNMSSFSFPIIKEIEKKTIFQWISQMGEQDQQVLDQSMSCNNFYFNIYTDILKISPDHLIKSIMRVSDSIKSSKNKINVKNQYFLKKIMLYFLYDKKQNNNSGQQSKMQQNLPAIQDEGDLELEGDEVTNKNIQVKNPYLSPKKQNKIQLLDTKNIDLKEQQMKLLQLLQNNSINKQNQLDNQEHRHTLSDTGSKDLINKILYQVESKKADSQPLNFNSNSNLHNTNYSQKNCFNFKSLDISEHMSSIKGINQNFNHFPQISVDETHANQLLHNSFHTNFLKNQEQNSSQFNNNQIQFQNIHIPSLTNNNIKNNKDDSNQEKIDEIYQKQYSQNQKQNEYNLQNEDEQISQNTDEPKNQFNQCYNLQTCEKINQTSLFSNFSNLIKTDDFIIQKPQIIKHLQPVQPGKILKEQQQQFLKTQLNQNLTKNNDIKNDINIFNIFSDQQLKYKTQDFNLAQNQNYHNQSVQSINSSHCQQSHQFLERKMTDQD